MTNNDSESMSMSPVCYVTRALGLLPFIQYATAAANTPVPIERLPRSPEQMSTFYTARGFPAPMNNLLAK